MDKTQSQTKPLPITKQMVWLAYKKVKTKGKACGVDAMSMKEFEEKLSGNLYKIWNRLASGTYFPPAVREVEIPKKDGKMRKLGIPTIGDRIAQTVVKDYMETSIDKLFHESSYGYRPLKSAHQALEQARRNVKRYDWVIDMDIKGFFDNISHDLLIKALDDRVAVVAASCSTYTIGTQVTMGLIPEQCDCTFYPNVFQIDFPEVLALIAPRPLLILGGRKDPIFPPAGFREAFMRTRRIYDLYHDAENDKSNIKLVESGEGHIDPPHFLSETRKWMCKWLRDFDTYDSPLEVQSPKPESSELLRCTSVIPQSAINSTIDDHWIHYPPIYHPFSLEEWSHRKDKLLDILRLRVFGWFPKHQIPYNTKRLIASGGHLADLADFGDYHFDSEDGLPVNACLITPKGKIGPFPCIIWVKGSSEHVTFPDLDEFYPFFRTHIIVILTPRFTFPLLSASIYARIERTAALIGRSITAMRIWDLLRTVSWVTYDRNLQPSEITVYGCGEQGIVGLYAALFDSTICHIVLRNPLVSHLDGPAIPTILRDTDIPEIASLLAPRRLTILSHCKESFEFTQSIYALNGADWALNYVSSLVDGILVNSEECKTLNANGVISC